MEQIHAIKKQVAIMEQIIIIEHIQDMAKHSAIVAKIQNIEQHITITEHTHAN